MTIALAELFSVGPLKGVIHSIEGSIYQLSVFIDAREVAVLDNNGRIFSRRCVHEVREALQGSGITELVLRHRSAYDEMVGQSVRLEDNTLEVPLTPQPEHTG